MRLRLRLTGEGFRLTGSAPGRILAGAPPPPPVLLATENGDPLVTELGEHLFAEPPHDQ
jgi:hypothetical protein